MKSLEIVRNESFGKNLREILDFIELKDSFERAFEFYKELEIEINKIAFMPYRYRKNLYKNDENIRDLIFKGYVIPFLIKADKIIILGIYKSNLPNF